MLAVALREVIALPTVGVRGIVDHQRGLRGEERPEGIAHHCEFVGEGCTERFLDRTRVRAVRDSLRVRSERALLDSLAGLVITLDVVEHFIGVEVAVVVRNGDRVRVPIKHARAEGTDHEVVRFEGLMNRRRHVELARDRGKVVDVEDVGVITTVPSHEIERVVGVDVGVHAVAGLDPHLELAFLIEGEGEFWEPQIALAVGRVLQELAGLLAHIAGRRTDMAAVRRFDDQELAPRHVGRSEFPLLERRIRIGGAGHGRGLIEHHLIRHTLGDDDVVFGPELERTHEREAGAGTKVHEDALIALAVLVVISHLLDGVAHGHFAVGVAEEDHAAGDRITVRLDACRLEVAHPHRVFFDVLGFGGVKRFPAAHLRGRVDVVHRARGAGKALGAEELFAVERTIGATKLDVAFLGDLTKVDIERHGRNLRRNLNNFMPECSGLRCRGHQSLDTFHHCVKGEHVEFLNAVGRRSWKDDSKVALREHAPATFTEQSADKHAAISAGTGGSDDVGGIATRTEYHEHVAGFAEGGDRPAEDVFKSVVVRGAGDVPGIGDGDRGERGPIGPKAAGQFFRKVGCIAEAPTVSAGNDLPPGLEGFSAAHGERPDAGEGGAVGGKCVQHPRRFRNGGLQPVWVAINLVGQGQGGVLGHGGLY